MGKKTNQSGEGNSSVYAVSGNKSGGYLVDAPSHMFSKKAHEAALKQGVPVQALKIKDPGAAITGAQFVPKQRQF